jgi:CO dehydrogenase/acetyl-CoA synthase gamma subunit (corrinoid Fe-S protein)
MAKRFVEELFKNLPKTDCKKCGFKTCGEFARALLKNKRVVTDCPYVNNDQIQAINLILDEYFNL